jgi:LysM repeat protein
MNEHEQAQLLEAFLLSLHQDANAAPPPGLDPAAAAFARKLAAPQAAPSNAIRDRVWRNALAEVRPTVSTAEKQERILTTQTAVLPRRRAYPLTFAAAALVLVALTGAFAASFANRPKEEPLQALAQTTQEATAAPTAIPTSTLAPGMPIPVPTLPPVWMPTAVPAAVLSIDLSNAVNISVGDTINGTLTAEKPALTYRLVAPQDGLLAVYLEAKDNGQPTITILSPHFSPGLMLGSAAVAMQSAQVMAAQAAIQAQMATIQAAVPGQPIIPQAQVQALTQSQGQPATAQTNAQSQIVTAQADAQGQVATTQAKIATAQPAWGSTAPYTVQEGDTLGKLAGRLGTSPEVLILLNPDQNLSCRFDAGPGAAQCDTPLKAGTVIHVPAPLPPAGVISLPPAAPLSLQPVVPTIGVGPVPPVPVVTLPNITFGPGTYPVPVHAGDELILQVSGAAPGAFRITSAQVEENRLQYGSVAENALTDSSFIYYTFEGQAGDLVNITVDANDEFDTNLELWSGDFSTRYADDDGGAGSNPEFYNLPLMQTGTYHLLIQSAVPGAAGRFRLSLDKVKSLSLDSGPQEVTLNAKTTPLVFIGKAGESITLTVRAARGSVHHVIQLQQNGALFGQFDNGPEGEASMTTTVPADGPVQVYILPTRSLLGTATLEISLKR